MRKSLKAARCIIAAAGLTLISGWTGYSATTTNLLSETTFDPAAASPWGYGYFYGNNGLGYQEYNRAYYLAEDVEMTNAMWFYSFDLTDLAGTTGYGTGTGGPLYLKENSPGSFSSTNREDYILTFDARVAGLAAGKTSANGEMQAQFYYPDENGTAVKILQVNIPFAPTAEWKTFTFTLDQGTLGDNTSDAVFAQHHSAISEVRFNVNFHEPNSTFDFDSGNEFYLDNVKLAVVNKPTVTPIPATAVTIIEWNFDDKTVTSEYHYEWSQNDLHASVTAGNNANGADPNKVGRDGTSGWFVNLDTSGFADNPPQWSGGGSGGGGTIDYTQFKTGDLAAYRVTFDARVAGLAEGRPSTTAALQLHIDSPDDTIQPADEDGNADFIIQLNFAIGAVGPDWQTYSFLLSKGSVANGSKANFASYYNKLAGFRTQWQIENASSLTDWGYDAENTLIVDNFKLERLDANLGSINATQNGNQLVLTWTDNPGVKLQVASTLAGPYNEVAGATSGYTTALTGAGQFYRLAQSASAGQ